MFLSGFLRRTKLSRCVESQNLEKVAKKDSTTTLELFFLLKLIIDKIGQNSRGVAFTKWSVWVENEKSQKDAKTILQAH